MFTPKPLLECLTDIETREFLPAGMHDELLSYSKPHTHIDPSDISLEEWHERLREINPEILVSCWKTPPLPDVLPPALRYVCYLAGSVKKLVTRQHITDSLVVTNWGHSISRTVAEGALLHVLSCLRRSPHWAVQMHVHGAWKARTSQTASLFGRRVGLRGYGRVAHSLIELLRPFGCNIGVLAPDMNPEKGIADNVRSIASLDELMSEHDVIVELAPLIEETRRSIGEDHLRLLRPGSVFVNVGRGATVDEIALEKIAREGEISIGLDVFSQEPLPADSGFRGLSNVSLSPHLAGPTSDRRRDAGAHGLLNLAAYLNGEELSGQITPVVYDHST
ncbi:MAG: hydroxyacid dehydrogenase [Verrucomicrobiia bacterium]|tara:strand:+ start:2983 stop:3987 length:1005 start_codon:yes stop_codon:yes gene_type:complete